MVAMPNIFNADIAGKLNQAMGSLVFDIVLIKRRDSERAQNLTGGRDSVETSYSCKGFVDDYKEYQIDGTLVKRGDRKVVILGGSFSQIPEVNDFTVAEDETRKIINVTRDPAGATYECQVR